LGFLRISPHASQEKETIWEEEGRKNRRIWISESRLGESREVIRAYVDMTDLRGALNGVARGAAEEKGTNENFAQL